MRSRDGCVGVETRSQNAVDSAVTESADQKRLWPAVAVPFGKSLCGDERT
jgi:hypothetical protein